jgi:hypothetical protein
MLNGLASELLGGGADGLPATCPSGDCTFPNFLSLAVCSECADLADLAIQACVEDENGNRIECTWKVSTDQISVRAINQTTTITSQYGSYVIDASQFNLTVMAPSRSTHFKDIGSYIIAFSMASASLDSDNLLAAECVLFWCVQTYNASVTQNIKSEEVISYFYNTTNNAPNIFPGELISPTNASSNNTLADLNYGQIIQLIPTNVPDSVYNADYPFTVDSLANFTVSAVFSDWLEPSSWDNISTIQSGSNLTGCLNYFISAAYSEPQTSESNETTAYVGGMMSKIASSMTDSIRISDGYGGVQTGDFKAFGTSWTSETYVHVRWEWLVFPAILACVALFFILAVMINTARSNTRIWKADPLALIFHGLDLSTQIETGEKETLSEMKEVARDLSVSLVQTSNGSKLSTQYPRNMHTADA